MPGTKSARLSDIVSGRIPVFLVVAGFFALWCAWSFLSTELYSDDDIAHFMFARYAPEHPALFMDVWGRPLFTMLYCPGAQFGLIGARLTSALIGAAVCWLVYEYARARGYDRPWLAPLILISMPRFFGMCYNLDTALAACLVIAAALALHARGKDTLAALVLSLSPAARLECALFVVLAALFLLAKRRWLHAGLVFAGPALWNLAGFAVSGDPLWLLHNNPYVEPYGSASMMYYVTKLDELAGPAHLPFFVAGLVMALKYWRERDNLIFVLAWVSFFLFMAVSLRMGAPWTSGLTRYFNTVAPVTALLALEGVNRALKAEKDLSADAIAVIVASVAVAFLLVGWKSSPVLAASAVTLIAARLAMTFSDRPALPLGAVAAGLLAVAVSVGAQSYPKNARPELRALKEAATVYSGLFSDRYTLSSNMWFAYYSGTDPFGGDGMETVSHERLTTAPSGTIVVWEPHYAAGKRYGKVPFIYFLANRDKYRLLYSGENIYMFEKMRI